MLDVYSSVEVTRKNRCDNLMWCMDQVTGFGEGVTICEETQEDITRAFFLNQELTIPVGSGG